MRRQGLSKSIIPETRERVHPPVLLGEVENIAFFDLLACFFFINCIALCTNRLKFSRRLAQRSVSILDVRKTELKYFSNSGRFYKSGAGWYHVASLAQGGL